MEIRNNSKQTSEKQASTAWERFGVATALVSLYGRMPEPPPASAVGTQREAERTIRVSEKRGSERRASQTSESTESGLESPENHKIRPKIYKIAEKYEKHPKIHCEQPKRYQPKLTGVLYLLT